MADASLRASGIYAIRNTINGKVYIGSAVCFGRRWNMHRHKLRQGEHHSKKLQASWNKHGASAFVFEVLELVYDLEQLIPREQALIDSLGALGPNGYNMSPTAGSIRGYKHTEETKRRLSAASKGVLKPGTSAALKGRKLSAEHVTKVAKAHTGSKRSLTARANMSKAMKGRQNWLGRTHSQETKDKIGALAKARSHPKGHTHSAESIERMRAAKAGRCIAVEVGGVRYASHRIAAEALGFDKARIGQMVKEGKAKLAA
ncbi:NUMOD3 domain-containing DNA-binding protein [Variovorax boronicumulans]|uniref:NUMOD3 domain-containing DNA-binding protein n=1 Tax=Variovorax boronicumulans TaxID=436515 RepID=UPI0012E54040|nr:NUMOD3 domain-containing DNA-binding protein [Variovorax boronicumulans]GER21480.1 hypothetical protein VCH24_65370 [Variovorax boronicumulans]